jgi:hypothetical protein
MKKIVVFLTLTLVLIGLTGCFGGDDDGTVTRPKDDGTTNMTLAYQQIDKFSESFLDKDEIKLKSVMSTGAINFTVDNEDVSLQDNDEFILYVQQELWDQVEYSKFEITNRTGSEGINYIQVTGNIITTKTSSDNIVVNNEGYIQIQLEKVDNNCYINNINIVYE